MEDSSLLQAAYINALFGFRMECIERLGEKQGVFAWNRINSMFNWLPLAALIEDRIICMHGGEDYSSPFHPSPPAYHSQKPLFIFQQTGLFPSTWQVSGRWMLYHPRVLS